ncbi:MAG: LysM peptidoglycan-binding domain-containing protein [Clostridiaceae bacterium]
MENTTRITVSAVTHIGAMCTVNDDRIYANGRFLHTSIADYAQISLEVNESKCLFALSDGMEDEDSGISLTNDLKKFHQKAQGSSKDIHVKLDELVQYVEQSSNLLHSISLGDNDFRERKTAFAGLLIDEGSIAAVNLGSCRIYKLEGDSFKLLVNDYKRAERLLKMGIISSEQAEMLSGQQKSSMEEGRSTVKKSDISPLKEGVIYLICTSGLTEAVSEDAIYDIIASNSNADEAAGKLVAEAVKNEGEENITAMVVKVEAAGEMPVQQPGPRMIQYKAARSGSIHTKQGRAAASVHGKMDGAGRVVYVAVLIVLAAAVLFGGFKLWQKLRNPEDLEASSAGDTQKGTLDNSSTNPVTNDGTVDVTIPGTDSETANTGDGTGDGSTAEPGTDEPDLVGPDGTTYIVKSGDMLMTISKRFYGDESKYTLIMKANDIENANMIAVGQKLKIPPLK